MTRTLLFTGVSVGIGHALLEAMERLPDLVESGAFTDSRSLATGDP